MVGRRSLNDKNWFEEVALSFVKLIFYLFCWSVRVCEDFIATVKTSEVGPVPTLLVSFLQQAVASITTTIGPLSACLPEDLVRLMLASLYSVLFFPFSGLCAEISSVLILVFRLPQASLDSDLLQTNKHVPHFLSKPVERFDLRNFFHPCRRLQSFTTHSYCFIALFERIVLGK